MVGKRDMGGKAGKGCSLELLQPLSVPVALLLPLLQLLPLLMRGAISVVANTALPMVGQQRKGWKRHLFATRGMVLPLV